LKRRGQGRIYKGKEEGKQSRRREMVGLIERG
jgi:hypothetical protein